MIQSVPRMEKFTLTEADAATLLQQTVARSTPVALVALDYNWGPPVSGRFDNDFLQIWVAGRLDLHPQEIRLIGNYGRHLDSMKWSDELAFRYMRNCGTHGLYYLSNAVGLATELAVMMVCENGCIYYDNNGGYGKNYRLIPYRGRGTTAISCEHAIVRVKDIVAVQLHWKDKKQYCTGPASGD